MAPEGGNPEYEYRPEDRVAYKSLPEIAALEVRWLCRSCHRRWDRKEPKTLPARP